MLASSFGIKTLTDPMTESRMYAVSQKSGGLNQFTEVNATVLQHLCGAHSAPCCARGWEIKWPGSLFSGSYKGEAMCTVRRKKFL